MTSYSNIIVATLRNRLTACHATITGINTSLPEYAHMPKSLGEVPIIAHTLADFNDIGSRSNTVAGTFTFLGSLYVSELASDIDDENGSVGLQTATTLIDRINAYHTSEYLLLATPDLPKLRGVPNPIRISGQVTTLFDANRDEYIGVQFRFEIDYEDFKVR